MGTPRKFRYEDGEMLTAQAIAQRTGLSVKTVLHRAQHGMGFGPRRKGGKRPNQGRKYAHDGREQTALEWAREFNCTTQAIRARAIRGAPLDGSATGRNHKGALYGAAGYDTSLQGQASVFDDALSYDDDRAVVEVERYLSRCCLMMTDEEIRAQFADLGRLSDEGVSWAREQAEAILFVHMKTGHGESLEMIGDLHGHCRERVRQVEAGALRRLRLIFQGRGMEAGIRAELRERDTRRKATWAEIMDAQSPDHFDTAPRKAAS